VDVRALEELIHPIIHDLLLFMVFFSMRVFSFDSILLQISTVLSLLSLGNYAIESLLLLLFNKLHAFPFAHNLYASDGSCTTISITDLRLTEYPVSISVRVRISIG